MRMSRKLVSVLAVSACAALTAVVPSAASADQYLPNEAGYSEAVENDGLCVPPVVCPLIDNNLVGAGGADGGSYLETGFLAILTTELTTNSGIWTSAPFTFNGTGGATPASVTFDMARRSDVEGLLGVNALNRATYSVDLVNTSVPGVISVISDAPLAGAPDWESIASVGINPALLTVGQNYRIRVTTTYKTVAALLPMGSADYDGVRLNTSGVGAGGGGDGAYNPYSGLSALSNLQACIKNAKKKVKKLKITKKKKKKILKKKIANCNKKFKKKKKKVKKKRKK